MTDTTKLKLYTKIFLWASSKYRRAYLKVHYNDMMCPNCREWLSITSLKGENKREHLDLENLNDCEKRTCGQCGTESYWVWGIIPAYMRVDEKGNIL